MRVLLTGASGFLGTHVLAQLRAHEFDVVAVGRRPPDGHAGEFIAADLLHPGEAVAAVERARASHLLHLAWYAEYGLYWTSPLNLRWVEASLRLVEAFCAGGGRALVAAGSCAEYDWSHGYCREDTTPLTPATLYGTAKDATRRLLAAVCAAQGVAFAWGRVFLPYGAGEDRRRLIPSLTEVFAGQCEPFGVNAAAWRDFLHAEDVARGFVHLLRAEATGSYNIASGRPTRIADVVRQLAAAARGDAGRVLALASARPGEPDLLVGDNNKLRALGWQPIHAPLGEEP
jgi:nucleoside-diphosphate-sugar epimerase